MDGSFWQTAAWVLAGWSALSLLVAAGLSCVFRAAHQRERALATEVMRAPRRRYPPTTY